MQPIRFDNKRNRSDRNQCKRGSKKKAAKNEIRKSNKNAKFSLEEDEHLKQGLKKYGKRNWSSILKDKVTIFISQEHVIL